MRSTIATNAKATTPNPISWINEMPRYFFHLHGSGARDTEGQELPDNEAARQEARLVARELSQNRKVATDERLIVTNEKGEVIHEERFFPR